MEGPWTYLPKHKEIQVVVSKGRGAAKKAAAAQLLRLPRHDLSTIRTREITMRKFRFLLHSIHWAFCLLVCCGSFQSDAPSWQHLSSKTGDLPVPGPSTQQTGALVADLDKNGIADFVLGFRQKAPAL